MLLLVKTWKEWWEESNTTLSITYYIMCFIKWWSAQKTSLICCCCCSISCKLLKVHWFDLVTAACEGWHRHYTLLKRLSKFCPQSGIISMTTLSMMIDLLNKMPIKLAILLDIFFRSRVVPLDDKRQSISSSPISQLVFLWFDLDFGSTSRF